MRGFYPLFVAYGHELWLDSSLQLRDCYLVIADH